MDRPAHRTHAPDHEHGVSEAHRHHGTARPNVPDQHGHEAAPERGGHDKHAGHSVAMFRDKGRNGLKKYPSTPCVKVISYWYALARAWRPMGWYAPARVP